MSKDVLYYPTIEFAPSDYEWLWRASLLWDKVYRIVPDGYMPADPPEIQELCSTGEIGIKLSPNSYSSKASTSFIDKLNNRDWQAIALQYADDDLRQFKDYAKLHKSKADVALRELALISNDCYENDEWLCMPREMANQYMVYLATEIARSNTLSLYTSNDGNVQEGFFPGEDYVESNMAALASVVVNNVFPTNLLDVTPKQLHIFRTKRKDERQQFQNAVDEFYNKLNSVTDPYILKQIIKEEIDEVEYALGQYKKSMDILRAVKFGGLITSFVTIVTDALGYVDFGTQIVQPLTTTGIGISIITGLLEKKLTQRQTPYSYLGQRKNERSRC